MNNRKHWIIRLFIIFFTLSISVAVIPCGVINVYGPLGEVYSSTSIEAETENEQIKSETSKYQKIKGINIFNIWFILCIIVMYISFFEYVIRLPRADTIITLKVRMDN